MNLKPLINSELRTLGLGDFAHLTPKIEKEIATDAEKAVRKLVAAGCNRVLRAARQKTKQPKKETKIMFLKKNNEFTFGKDNFMGDDLRWSLDRLPLGICVMVGTGTGKTNRVFLPFFIAWLRLRAR